VTFHGYLEPLLWQPYEAFTALDLLCLDTYTIILGAVMMGVIFSERVVEIVQLSGSAMVGSF
jgi:hypothetical protein